MVATTYGVGELSALNGVMGAKAERSLVFHVVGMPSYQNQRLSRIAHHTLGDGNFGNFAGLSAAAACCSAIINSDNCVIEVTLKSNEAALKKAIAAIRERLKGAKSVVALPAFTVARLGL
jgi:indolepyruvate decarboxylase